MEYTITVQASSGFFVRVETYSTLLPDYLNCDVSNVRRRIPQPLFLSPPYIESSMEL